MAFLPEVCSPMLRLSMVLFTICKFAVHMLPLQGSIACCLATSGVHDGLQTQPKHLTVAAHNNNGVQVGKTFIHT